MNTLFQNFSSLVPIVMDTDCVDGLPSSPHAFNRKLSVVLGLILSMSGSKFASRYSVDDDIRKVVSRNRAYSYNIITSFSLDFNYTEILVLIIVHNVDSLFRIKLFKMMNELPDEHQNCVTMIIILSTQHPAA